MKFPKWKIPAIRKTGIAIAYPIGVSQSAVQKITGRTGIITQGWQSHRENSFPNATVIETAGPRTMTSGENRTRSMIRRHDRIRIR
jgi:hypothetical protein